jgi:hypothetical protein
MLMVVVMVLGTASIAQADPTTFFGQDAGQGEGVRLATHPNADAARNNFTSNLSGVGTESFETFPNGTSTPLILVFQGAGTATLSGSGSVSNVPSGTNGFGRYPITGNQFFEVSGQFVIDFSSPVAAFGLYATDIGDFNGQLTLTLLRTDNTTFTLTVPADINVSGGGVLYFGLIDTANPFTRITFGNTAGGVDVFGFDDMTVGSVAQVQPVPEPATMFLLGTGLAGIAMKARRRRKAGRSSAES